MELHQLETFLAVAEERSFSRAAVRLHRTQPAISQVIRKLEEAVGETLFDRAARDGSLTASGVLLRDYALRLSQIGAHASMSRPGTPQDNAKAESFMRTLKAEEVDGKAYRSREDAESKIGAFIDDVYNARRLHSSIGYKPPIEFEHEFRQAQKREANQPTPVSQN